MVRILVGFWLVGAPGFPMVAGLAKASGLAIDLATGSSIFFSGGTGVSKLTSILKHGCRFRNGLISKRNILVFGLVNLLDDIG